VLKKNGKLKICVDFKKLNVTTKRDSYPLFFIDEVINIVTRHEVYTFLDGFSRDQYKTAFITYWGAFVWVIMPFKVKNGPPTYQRIITKAFCEYIDVFIKILLDDFIISNDLSTHF
jgi:hypothetical protein